VDIRRKMARCSADRHIIPLSNLNYHDLIAKRQTKTPGLLTTYDRKTVLRSGEARETRAAYVRTTVIRDVLNLIALYKRNARLGDRNCIQARF
jgi:hypothetical protein